ncbi:MAG TPA: transcriptional repressor [Candidatus Paceibacterota bacterium]|nr:transcriptional repressor [Candidatus Paceibacterota bacterium]
MAVRTIDHAAVLRSAGLKATKDRLVLLEHLHDTRYPLGIPELKSWGRKHGVDTVTLYRTLESLKKAGLVKRTDLQHGHAEYELSYDREHHHHIVCVGCGEIENIEFCPEQKLLSGVLSSATRFTSLSDHAIEFFGTCVSCA